MVMQLYRVLVRPNLFLGGERLPVMVTLLVFGSIGINSQNPWIIAACFLLWLLALGVFRQLAKWDPQWIAIYLRQLKYRNHYPARTHR